GATRASARCATTRACSWASIRSSARCTWRRVSKRAAKRRSICFSAARSEVAALSRRCAARRDGDEASERGERPRRREREALNEVDTLRREPLALGVALHTLRDDLHFEQLQRLDHSGDARRGDAALEHAVGELRIELRERDTGRLEERD